MGVAIFFLLTLIVTGVIVYPLLPGRRAAEPAPAASDGEIEQAVRNIRRARSAGSQFCPTCGQTHQVGDRFCVRCGGALPQPAAAGPACPSCNAAVHEGDQFCPKCGARITAGEVA